MSIRSVLLHPAVWFVLATIATIFGSMSLWNQYSHEIVAADDFRLTADNIRLVEPEPEWVQTDIKQMLLNQEPSILDSQLVPYTASIVQSFGWVEGIRRIEKSSTGLEIDVAFRNPVAMVKINPEQSLPIDRNGFVLDGDLFQKSNVDGLMRISVFRPLPTEESLMIWKAWPDQRIKHAAMIGELFKEKSQALELYRIVTFQLPGTRANPEPFEIWTHGHVQPGDVSQTPYAAKIIWGNAPGFENVDEAPAIVKLQGIEDYVARKGPLALSVPKGKLLDVRSGRPILTSTVRSAKQEKFSESLRR